MFASFVTIGATIRRHSSHFSLAMRDGAAKNKLEEMKKENTKQALKKKKKKMPHLHSFSRLLT